MKSQRIWFSVFVVFISAFIVISGMFSCMHDSDELELLDEVCFESDVLPIFLSSCSISGCHDQTGKSGYIFTTYQGIKKAVVPGNPKGSPAYKSLINKWSSEGMMPPGQPLSEANRTLIRVWISQGARLTSCIPIDSATYSNPRACFQRDVLPVLFSSCAVSGCHDAITAKEGYKFIDYINTMKAVKISNPTDSKLYRVIIKTDPDDRMPPPPYDPLPAEKIEPYLPGYVTVLLMNSAANPVILFQALVLLQISFQL